MGHVQRGNLRRQQTQPQIPQMNWKKTQMNTRQHFPTTWFAKAEKWTRPSAGGWGRWYRCPKALHVGVWAPQCHHLHKYILWPNSPTPGHRFHVNVHRNPRVRSFASQHDRCGWAGGSPLSVLEGGVHGGATVGVQLCRSGAGTLFCKGPETDYFRPWGLRSSVSSFFTNSLIMLRTFLVYRLYRKQVTGLSVSTLGLDEQQHKWILKTHFVYKNWDM